MTTNTLLTNAEISNEALRILTNSLKFTKKIKNNYSDKFGQSGNKIGTTYNLRLPMQWKRTTGSEFQAQGAKEYSVPIVLDNWVQRGLQMSTEDMYLSMDMFSNRVLKTQMVSAANQIDEYNLEKAIKSVFNAVGTAGSAPADQAAFNALVTDTRVRLLNSLAEPEIYTMICEPRFSALGARFNTNVFNPQAVIGDQYIKGYLTTAFGFEWNESQIVPKHTNGTFSGTPKVNGGSQSGAVLATDGWGAGTTLNVGDIFTIANVYAVNAQTKQVQDFLQQFVVTAKNAASTSQALAISPAIVGPEDAQYQNVSALPADNADITVVGTTGQTYNQQLSFDEDAFGVAYAKFELPKDVGVKSVSSIDTDTGANITYATGYDLRSYAELHRLDTLTGFVAQYPQLACRTVG